MRAFLYFVPNLEKPPSEKTMLREPFGHAFDKPAKIDSRFLQKGPGDCKGMLLAARDALPPEGLRYDPAHQDWIEHQSGGYWVGVAKGQLPSPEELLRKQPIPGHYVDLADGNAWLVPVARSWSATDDAEQWLRYTCELEQQMQFDGAEFRCGNVVPKHAELWAISAAVLHRYEGSESEEERELLTGLQAFTLAIRVLQANYKIGACEASLLGLISTELPGHVFRLLNDFAQREAVVQKKTEQLAAALATSSAGPAVTLPATDPAS